jgi:hypothetical protein
LHLEFSNFQDELEQLFTQRIAFDDDGGFNSGIVDPEKDEGVPEVPSIGPFSFEAFTKVSNSR